MPIDKVTELAIKGASAWKNVKQTKRFFSRGAYTASDNALCKKVVWLCKTNIDLLMLAAHKVN